MPFGDELKNELISKVLVDGAGKIIQAFSERTGEQVGKTAGDWITFQIWGMKTEDERLFNRALTLIPQVDWARHSKRLIPPAMSRKAAEYYRITVMHPDHKVIAETLLNHTRMSDAAWKRHLEFMHLEFERDNAVWGRFTTWASQGLGSLLHGFTNIGGAITNASNETTAAINESGILTEMNSLTDYLLGLTQNNVQTFRQRREERRK